MRTKRRPPMPPMPPQRARLALLAAALLLGGAAAPDESSEASPGGPACGAEGGRWTHFATAWDYTCEKNLTRSPKNGKLTSGKPMWICKNYSSISVNVLLGPPAATKAHPIWNKQNDEANYGTNASLSVPQVLHGGPAFYPYAKSPPRAAPGGEFGWMFGTASLPEGRRAIRIHGPDRKVLIGGPPGDLQAADDEAAGGVPYNISGSTSAPPAGPMQGHYPADAPCPRNVVANWIGPWPGIWWDHSAEWLGNQSLEFFSAYKAAGGELDEIVLDTELDGFETFSVAVSLINPVLPSHHEDARTLSGAVVRAGQHPAQPQRLLRLRARALAGDPSRRSLAPHPR